MRLHRADAGVGLVEIVFNAKHAPVLRCPDCVLHSCHVLAECLLPLLSLLERGHLANPKHTTLPSFAKQITNDCVLADLLLLRPRYLSLLLSKHRVLVVRWRERHCIPHNQLANLLQHRAGLLTRRSAEVVDGF